MGTARWAILVPREHASQTHPLSKPPSSSPQGWCSPTRATKAVRVSGMGREDYHEENVP